MGGDLTGTVNAAGNGLTLTRPDGSAALGYSGLSAYDATGKTLPASLQVQAVGGRQELLIHVDMPGPRARSPSIPSCRRPTHRVRCASGDFFGNSVSISGSTVVVGGAQMLPSGSNGQGVVYIFTMPATGWDRHTRPPS